MVPQMHLNHNTNFFLQAINNKIDHQYISRELVFF